MRSPSTQDLWGSEEDDSRASESITGTHETVIDEVPYSRWRQNIPAVPDDVTPENCMNLEDLVKMQLPSELSYFNDNPLFLSRTKAMSKTEENLKEHQRLERIVFAPVMLVKLILKVKDLLKAFSIDVSQRGKFLRFVVGVSPVFTCIGLCPVISSEREVEDWVTRMILIPALHIVLALRAKTIPDVLPKVGKPGSPSANPNAVGPYISSSSATKSIPDRIVVDVGSPDTKATIEVKTNNVLEDTRTSRRKFVFADILRPHPDRTHSETEYIYGRAIKFIWPEGPFWTGLTGDNLPTPADKQTRLLVQVSLDIMLALFFSQSCFQIWTQLVRNECDLGLLSSYILSMFYYRRGTTLFVSGTFKNTEDILLAAIAWMAVVLKLPGFEETELDLPDVDDTWYPTQAAAQTAYGVVTE